MTDFKPNCLPTIIGSMPHTNPEAACSLITRFLIRRISIRAIALTLYRRSKKFLARGCIIACGIVPSDEESLAKETVDSLHVHLEEAMKPFIENGTSFRQLLE